MADTKQSSGILGKPIEQMKVAELSVQLQNRGLSTSGRKAELVERLKKVSELVNHQADLSLRVNNPGHPRRR